MTTEVRVPTLGESVSEATVATWFKKPGDAVAVDEMLCELETDKVSVEVPSPAAGVLAEILAEEGVTVDAKARLAIITEGAAGAAPRPAERPASGSPDNKGAYGNAAPPVGSASGGEDGITAGEVGSPGAGPEQGDDVVGAEAQDRPDAGPVRVARPDDGVPRRQVR